MLRRVQGVDPSPGAPAIAGPRFSSVGEVQTPDPGTPFHRAFIAGRIALAFDGGDGAGLDPRGDRCTLCLPEAEPPEQLNPFSLTAIEALDVEERPYIWDL